MDDPAPDFNVEECCNGLPLRAATMSRFSLIRALKATFLPASVTPDYAEFQVWDSVQAICSYVRGTMSSDSILRGLGVNQSVATSLSPVVVFFLRDLSGMLGGLLFATLQGRSLDVDAKQWRLLADLANNVGYTLELAAPIWPGAFMACICLASLARAVTGVAGSATRAALTQHFARSGNAADVAAKEGSQETATTIVGMVLGVSLTTWVSGRLQLSWLLFAALTLAHIGANIKALRALHLMSLNPTRLELLVNAWVQQGRTLQPHEVAGQETLLVPPLRRLLWQCKPITFGARLEDLGGACSSSECKVSLKQAYESSYCIVLEGQVPMVLLRSDSRPADQLRAYVHALVLQAILKSEQAKGSAYSDAAVWMQDFPRFHHALQDAGWDVSCIRLPFSPTSYRIFPKKAE